MTKIIDVAGKSAALSATNNDENLSSLSGINEQVTGATYTVDINDQNRTIEFNRSGGVAVTLTSLATITGALHTDDFRVVLFNAGSGDVVISKNGADTFSNGIATITLETNKFVELQSDHASSGGSAGAWNIIRSSDSEYMNDAGISSQTYNTSAVNDTFSVGQVAVGDVIHFNCAFGGTKGATAGLSKCVLTHDTGTAGVVGSTTTYGTFTFTTYSVASTAHQYNFTGMLVVTTAGELTLKTQSYSYGSDLTSAYTQVSYYIKRS